jgi:hypothetical protein
VTALTDDPKLWPYAAPERRRGSFGDWWALGKLEREMQNQDGSKRSFTVEVGVSLTPHGDFLHCEEEFWRLVGEKLPLIAQELGGGD